MLETLLSQQLHHQELFGMMSDQRNDTCYNSKLSPLASGFKSLRTGCNIRDMVQVSSGLFLFSFFFIWFEFAGERFKLIFQSNKMVLVVHFVGRRIRKKRIKL